MKQRLLKLRSEKVKIDGLVKGKYYFTTNSKDGWHHTIFTISDKALSDLLGIREGILVAFEGYNEDPEYVTVYAPSVRPRNDVLFGLFPNDLKIIVRTIYSDEPSGKINVSIVIHN